MHGVIGRYRIEAPLGRGGMGVVYRAVDPETGRAVALKLLAGAANPTRLERLRREGELAARLRHPAIVTVHAAFVHEGRPALVYELVEGRSLDVAWEDLDRAARVELVRQVAHGVAHAHERGVVHRDIKAENVVVGEDGGPKLIDFGLAVAADLERLTATGALTGSPRAMAPEQLGGDRAAVGPCTDVWALGVLLHEALLGRPPFEADDLQTLLARVVGARVEPLRAADPTVSPALEAVCMRCLAAAPTERYADAGALARDLDRVARGEAPEALARAPGVRARALGALGLAVGGLLIVAVVSGGGRASTVSEGAVGSATTVTETVEVAPASGGRRSELERASARGDPDAMLELGRVLLAEAPEGALTWLERAGETGRAEAWWLGARYLGGPVPGRTPEDVYEDAGAARDAEAALRWLGRAAELGDSRGMRRLGEVYEDGWCVGRDLPEAARWYTRAAEGGDARGMELLARLLDDGAGVARDAEAAASWHARARGLLPGQAEAGDPDAAATLGELLLGAGAGAPDPDAAIPWLRRAVEGGSAEATVWLGAALLLRPALERAPGEALALLERGQRMWRGHGARYLAQAYENGVGVPKERALAVRWYERAVEHGDAASRAPLGRLLLDDPTRRAEGLDRLRAAGREGDVEAARALVTALPVGEEALRWGVVAARGSEEYLDLARELVARLACAPGTLETIEALAGDEPIAEHLLGWLHELEEPPRWDAALARYEGALARGHAPSRWHRTLVLRRVGRDQEALVELRAQAEEGSVRAKRVLGQTLADGRGGAERDAEAFRWLLQAWNGGDERAAVHIAELAAAGRGVVQDRAFALSMLEASRRKLEKKDARDLLERGARLAVQLADELGDEAARARWAARLGSE